MGLSAPRTIYGIHSCTLYDRSTLLPYGIMKILGTLAFGLTGDFNDLHGGSSKYPWDSEAGVLNAELSGTIKEMPNFAFERFLGGTVTENSAEASGNCGAATNVKGTSVVAATGITTPSVLAGSEADLKTGLYVIRAVGAITVDVYCMSDVDFAEGTDTTFEDDDLKITASPLTIVQGNQVTVPNYGVEITGGAGIIALTIGDTASFYVRKINDGSSLITIGQSNASFGAFGVFMVSQEKSGGSLFETRIYKAKGIGLPISHTEADWLNSDITMRAMRDADENAVASFREIVGVNS